MKTSDWHEKQLNSKLDATKERVAETEKLEEGNTVKGNKERKHKDHT